MLSFKIYILFNNLTAKVHNIHLKKELKQNIQNANSFLRPLYL